MRGRVLGGLQWVRCTVLEPWYICGVHHQGTEVGAGWITVVLVEVVIGHYLSLYITRALELNELINCSLSQQGVNNASIVWYLQSRNNVPNFNFPCLSCFWFIKDSLIYVHNKRRNKARERRRCTRWQLSIAKSYNSFWHSNVIVGSHQFHSTSSYHKMITIGWGLVFRMPKELSWHDSFSDDTK